MKLITAISIGLIAVSSLFASQMQLSPTTSDSSPGEEVEELSDFEKAVQIIKKYETLHQPKHYPLVGYGHLVLKGEKFSRTKAMDEKEAEELLRKDLLKNCAVFRSFGKDSLLLGVLAYNIGSGATMRSSVVKKLKTGDRNIYENYIAHCRYRGKVHSGIRRRRIEEFETLFIKDDAPGKTAYAGGQSANPKPLLASTQLEIPVREQYFITKQSDSDDKSIKHQIALSPIHILTTNKQMACIQERQQYYLL